MATEKEKSACSQVMKKLTSQSNKGNLPEHFVYEVSMSFVDDKLVSSVHNQIIELHGTQRLPNAWKINSYLLKNFLQQNIY